MVTKDKYSLSNFLFLTGISYCYNSVSHRRLQHCIADADGNAIWRHPHRVRLECQPDSKYRHYKKFYAQKIGSKYKKYSVQSEIDALKEQLAENEADNREKSQNSALGVIYFIIKHLN